MKIAIKTIDAVDAEWLDNIHTQLQVQLTQGGFIVYDKHKDKEAVEAIMYRPGFKIHAFGEKAAAEDARIRAIAEAVYAERNKPVEPAAVPAADSASKLPVVETTVVVEPVPAVVTPLVVEQLPAEPEPSQAEPVPPSVLVPDTVPEGPPSTSPENPGPAPTEPPATGGLPPATDPAFPVTN